MKQNNFSSQQISLIERRSILLRLRVSILKISAVRAMGISFIGCQTIYRGGAGPIEEIPVQVGRIYFRTFSLYNQSDHHKKLRTMTVDSLFCESSRYYGKYKDFERDTAMWYWSICMYHIAKGRAPHSQLRADSVRLVFDSLQGEIGFTPLCQESHNDGYQNILCLDPLPLPKRYEGIFFVKFFLTMKDSTGATLLDSHPVTLRAGCWKERESDFWPGN